MKRIFALFLVIYCMISTSATLASSEPYEITITGTLLADFGYDYSQWNNSKANRELFSAICLVEMFYADDWKLTLPLTTPDYSVSTTILVGEYVGIGDVMVLALEQKEGFMFTYYTFVYLPTLDRLSITLSESFFSPYSYMELFEAKDIYGNIHDVENSNVYRIIQSLPDEKYNSGGVAVEPFDQLDFSDFLYEQSRSFPSNASISGTVYNGNAFPVTGYFYLIFKKGGRIVHRELVSIGSVKAKSSATWSDLIYSLDFDSVTYEDSTIIRD